jgi:CheY-like chemotaxis protein
MNEQQGSAASLAPSLAGPGNAVPARLLLVDDDSFLRGVAAKTPQHAGFEVSECASSEDALEHFEALARALVLLDVMMPGLDARKCSSGGVGHE